MRTQAALLRSTDGRFSLEDIDLDEPGPGEVAVRIVAVGVCHTDVLPRVVPLAPLPLIPGHEGAGVVASIGPGVVDVAVGDHVVLSFSSCGHCESCLSAHPAYCDEFGPRNMSGRRPDGSGGATDAAGDPVGARWFGQSSFARHAVVAARDVVVVPDDLPLEALGPLGCGVLTGAGAVFTALEVTPGTSLVVSGAGAVGLSAIMAAAAAGATTIVAVDLNADRLALARELGATHVVDGAADDVAKQLRAIRPGGLRYALDTTGVPSVISTALDSLRVNGVCGIVGIQRGPLSIGPAQLTVGRTLKGIIEGDAVPRQLIPRLLDLWAQGRFPFDRLVRTYPLARIDDAERAMRSGEVVKPVLVMD
ncbi:NAD(P)-dependent alcohol dehydrogenase [Gordonia caeni]|uniref:NAD(P)-dependent alcohol dehydrogenase n=1 Tax=Gordonia caeni TaxID=1007097 RepID=A0ABP7NV31_9ACTN